ncbi:enoyl-CoA hydratase/isomerase family protein [Pseudonocardia sp. NPDC049635]|uniref:enoyl-CoA hydratase/isomerase family protein n=1 Tax=Pseudonocardia sp. NPDC049635 TaxID=3155506 RepID=UPI0033FEEAA9
MTARKPVGASVQWDEIGEGIVVLRLDRPPVHAMDLEMCQAISTACRTVRERAEPGAAEPVRAVVLTGSGSVFSAGVDLAAIVRGGADYVARFLPSLDRVFSDVLTLEVPVVAALNGAAVGGGCVLACCADRLVAVDTAAPFGLPELALGVPFPVAAFEAVRHTMRSATTAAVYGGRVGTLDDAPWAGVLHDRRSPADLLRTAIETAEALAGADRRAFGRSKRQLLRPIVDRIVTHADADLEFARQIWLERLDSGEFRRFLDTLSA